MKYLNDVGTFVIVTVFIFIAVIFTPIDNDTINTSNNFLTGFTISPIYYGYAVPIKGIVVNNNLSFASSSDSLIRSLDATDDIVYRLGYISYDGSTWIPFNLSPAGIGTLNGNWIYNRGNATLSFTPSKLNLSASRNYSNNTFIIIFTCSKNITIHNWTCHDGWQIIAFNSKLNPGSSAITTKTPAHPFITEVSTNTYDAVNDMPPELTIDGNISDDSRWSGEGDGAWIKYTFKNSMTITGINILFYKSSNRIARFTLDYSIDDITWTKIADYSSSGTATNFETFNFNTITAKYFRIIGHGNTETIMANWTSIIEVQFKNTTMQASCTAETNSVFCSRLGKTCGIVTANDNCSNPRTVASCGNCLSNQTCTNNVCVNNVVIPPSPTGNNYYVATTGSDSNPGTLSQPWKTWNYGFNHLTPGDTLYIRGGIYTGTTYMAPASGSHRYGVYVSGISGTATKHITVQNYPGETPILDGSAWTITTGSIIGIRMNSCNYWDMKGLTVTNFFQHSDNAFNAPGLWLEDCTHMVLDSCVVHDCGDGFEMWGTMDNIYFNNCDSYQNHDRYIGDGSEKPGGLANGFYGAIGQGNHVFFDGCRSWANSDDGWDLFGGAGYVTWKNCWSFNNGNGYGGVTGDGDGFKIGPVSVSESGDQRVLYNCIAYNNQGLSGNGFDQNMGLAVPVKIYNGFAYNNNMNFQFYSASGSLIRNSISLGSLNPDEFGSNNIDHNSWQNGLNANIADFVSVDGSQLTRARNADGSLPTITFGHLSLGSDMIDKGIPVTGINYSGNAPDLGAFEYCP